MRLLTDRHIADYCNIQSQQERIRVVEEAKLTFSVMPVFELCRCLHHLARYSQISPALFRICWEQFINLFWQNSENGYFIHISEYPEEAFPQMLISLRDLGEYERQAPVQGSSTAYPDEFWPLTQRLRQLYQTELDEFKTLDDEQRRWRGTPPDETAYQPQSPPDDDYSVVLDTNIFLPLINQLPLDGSLVAANQIYMPSHWSAEARSRVRHIVNTRGIEGRFVVPVSVLEETDRVAHDDRRPQNYQQARDVLRTLQLNRDLPMWSIFRFEPLSQAIFLAFVRLYEGITVTSHTAQHWPDFGDMLVLAHGLRHGYPVASMEWSAAKKDWDIVRTPFPHLVLEFLE